MSTLQEELNVAKEWGFDDKTAIQNYIVNNGLESDYIELISELSKSALDRLDYKIRKHQWLAYPADNLYEMVSKKKIKPDVARLLDLAQRAYILDCSLIPVAEELKGKTEDMDVPNPFYQPALEELRNLGVKFKE